MIDRNEVDPLQLDLYAIELAQQRLHSGDPNAVAHSILALETGELPKSHDVEKLAKKLKAQMDGATSEGLHPQTLLGTQVLRAELDMEPPASQDPSK